MTTTKNYTLETMKKYISEFDFKPINTRGTWSAYSNKYDVNYSAILTCLIQQCGRLCDRYASDLFIDWYSIEKELENPDYIGGLYLFGIRQNGVDGNSFTLARLNGDKEKYRDIYLLDVQIEKAVSYFDTSYIEMTLYKLDI